MLQKREQAPKCTRIGEKVLICYIVANGLCVMCVLPNYVRILYPHTVIFFTCEQFIFETASYDDG
jgi:hypothetical protein